MSLTITCPRCAHVLDTWVRERETTFCEECGAPVRVPRGAAHTDREPPLDVLHHRAELAGQLGWHFDQGCWVRAHDPEAPWRAWLDRGLFWLAVVALCLWLAIEFSMIALHVGD